MSVRSDVIVLGAGLTGVSAAIELARAGLAVTLIDQDDVPLNRASLRNEGKVHLGFVFAHDESGATANLMLTGALRFRSVLARLIGRDADALSVSHPFVYLVPFDSLLTPDELEQRFSNLERSYREQLAGDAELDYLGTRPRSLFSAVAPASLGSHIRQDRFAGAFRTAELAIDPAQLARILRRAVDVEPRIRFLGRHTVSGVERVGDRFRVRGTSGAASWRLQAGQVVNASWESRFAIDRTIGIEHPAGWLHRLKYSVIARVPDELRSGPSVTMVVGRFGDVVMRDDGTAYFSWYPAGLRGWSHDLAPPRSWDAACSGKLPREEARSIGSDVLGAIDAWYPGVARATPLAVHAGVIVAYGRTDVDDPASRLHDRTRIGVTSCKGYHSVDPGKLTLAPFFGVRAAQAVLGVSRAA